MRRYVKAAVLLGTAIALCGSVEGRTRLWERVSGTARSISAGGGQIWIVGMDPVPGGYAIYRRDGEDWHRVPGGAVRLALDETGRPWVVNDSGLIYHWNGNAFDGPLPGRANDIAAAGGAVWVVGATPRAGGYQLYELVDNAWVERDGSGLQVAVDRDRAAWVVNADHCIYHWTGQSFKGPLICHAKGVGAGGGEVWALSMEPGSGAGVLRWDGKRFVPDSSGSEGWEPTLRNGTAIVADEEGEPWIITEAGEILHR